MTGSGEKIAVMMKDKMVKVNGKVGCIAQGRWWFIAEPYNILCGFNISERIIDRIEIIPYDIEICEGKMAYIQLLYNDGFLYLISSKVSDGRDIIKYCLDEEKFEVLNDNLNKVESDEYYGASVVGDKLYCVSQRNLQLYEYNLETGKRQIRVMRGLVDVKNKYILNHTAIGKDGNIYISIQGSDKVIEFDISKNEMHIIEIGAKNTFQFPMIACSKKYLYWFSNKGGEILYQYDLDAKKIVSEKIIEADHTYLYTLNDKYLACEMAYEKKIRVYNLQLEPLYEKETSSFDIGSWFAQNDELFRISSNDFSIEVYSGLNKVGTYTLEIPYAYIEKSSKYVTISLLHENNCMSLGYYIDKLVKG